MSSQAALNPRIAILPPALVNQIAAGEVVERPVSVLKELVENAIDSGADQIQIEFKNAGRERISVLDNGSGMSEVEMQLSIQRHATSKITRFEDLSAIHSFGFRGEALAAIASVSKLELISCQDEKLGGYQIQFEAGKLKNQGKLGFPKGTRVSVEDLFFNTPARLKFLKTERVEASRIFDWLQKISLGHPHIGFQITHNRTTQVFAKGETFLERLQHFLPKALIENLLPVLARSDAMVLKGYMLKPEQAKEVRSHQWWFVNHRIIQSYALTRAVYQGLNTLLMRGKHPVFFFELELDPAEIDVNVHPAKIEIKIHNESLVVAFIAESVRSAVRDYNQQKGLTASQASFLSTTNFVGSLAETHQTVQSFNNESGSAPAGGQSTPANNGEAEAGYSPHKMDHTPAITLSGAALSYPAASIPLATANLHEEPLLPSPELPQPLDTPFPHYAPLRLEPQNLPALEITAADRVRIIGRFEKYILAEKNSLLWLADAHAAHERVLYEKFRFEFRQKKVQSIPFLNPILVSLTPFEQFIWELDPEFWSKIGFEVRDLGRNEYAIQALPSLIMEKVLRRVSPEDFIHSLLSDLSSFDKTQNLDNFYHNIFASLACHSAVRGVEEISPAEMQNILETLLHYDLDQYCPHGRPILQKFTVRELDKWFKRV